MEEIIKFISEKLKVSESVARESSVKVLLQFAQKQTAGTEFEQYLSRIPGAACPAGRGACGRSQCRQSLGRIARWLPGWRCGKALSRLQAAGLEFQPGRAVSERPLWRSPVKWPDRKRWMRF